jgi:hypothetical protein
MRACQIKWWMLLLIGFFAVQPIVALRMKGQAEGARRPMFIRPPTGDDLGR